MRVIWGSRSISEQLGRFKSHHEQGLSCALGKEFKKAKGGGGVRRREKNVPLELKDGESWDEAERINETK